MAIIPTSQSKNRELAPQGTFVATCVDIEDQNGVVRQKFQSDEMEKVDLTTFLFTFRDKAGNQHEILSKTFRVSNHEKSALYAFLKAWTGYPPNAGFDCSELMGATALITVAHVPSKVNPDRLFANIAAISPVPDDLIVATSPERASASTTPPTGGRHDAR